MQYCTDALYMYMLCCFALFVYLTLLASFFLPSHLSFKNMYMYIHVLKHIQCTCTLYTLFLYMYSIFFIMYTHMYIESRLVSHVLFMYMYMYIVHVYAHVFVYMYVCSLPW